MLACEYFALSTNTPRVFSLTLTNESKIIKNYKKIIQNQYNFEQPKSINIMVDNFVRHLLTSHSGNFFLIK